MSDRMAELNALIAADPEIAAWRSEPREPKRCKLPRADAKRDQQPTRSISLSEAGELADTIAAAWALTVDELLSGGSGRLLTQARTVACLVLHERGYTDKQIGIVTRRLRQQVAYYRRTAAPLCVFLARQILAGNLAITAPWPISGSGTTAPGETKAPSAVSAPMVGITDGRAA